MYTIENGNCCICEQDFAKSDVDLIENEHPEWFKLHETSKTRVTRREYMKQFVKRITELRNERLQQCAIFGDGECTMICKKHLQQVISEMA